MRPPRPQTYRAFIPDEDALMDLDPDDTSSGFSNGPYIYAALTHPFILILTSHLSPLLFPFPTPFLFVASLQEAAGRDGRRGGAAVQGDGTSSARSQARGHPRGQGRIPHPITTFM